MKIFETTIAGYVIRVTRNSRLRIDSQYAVQYGEQSNMNLSYEQAATELGQCMFHALALEGRFDDPIPYVCPLCGQRIEDGKPCGCGARY